MRRDLCIIRGVSRWSMVDTVFNPIYSVDTNTDSAHVSASSAMVVVVYIEVSFCLRNMKNSYKPVTYQLQAV